MELTESGGEYCIRSLIPIEDLSIPEMSLIGYWRDKEELLEKIDGIHSISLDNIKGAELVE